MAKRKRPVDYHAEENHHILWQARRWDSAGQYSRLLRLHPYMIKRVPRDTLHKELHGAIAEIPVPDQSLCKKALLSIQRGLDSGRLSEDDTIEKRIDFLLDAWGFEVCPKTFLLMKWQKEMVHDFYKCDYYVYKKM